MTTRQIKVTYGVTRPTARFWSETARVKLTKDIDVSDDVEKEVEGTQKIAREIVAYQKRTTDVFGINAPDKRRNPF